MDVKTGAVILWMAVDCEKWVSKPVKGKNYRLALFFKRHTSSPSRMTTNWLDVNTGFEFGLLVEMPSNQSFHIFA